MFPQWEQGCVPFPPTALTALTAGDTLTISLDNPFQYWVHEDFWDGGANPDYNMPTTQREEIWSKSPADGSNILIHECQVSDSHSERFAARQDRPTGSWGSPLEKDTIQIAANRRIDSVPGRFPFPARIKSWRSAA